MMLLCFIIFFMGDLNFVKVKKDAYMSCLCSQPTSVKLKCKLKKTLKSRLVNC